jgi:hypothetical protein
MFVNDAHDALCENACLSCLLSFDAQEVMRQNLLNRRAAIKALDALLDGGKDGVMPPFTPEPSQPGRIQNGVPSAAERLERAKNRRTSSWRRSLVGRDERGQGNRAGSARHRFFSELQCRHGDAVSGCDMFARWLIRKSASGAQPWRP